MKGKYFIVAVCTAFCVGCISQGDVQYHQTEVKTMKRNIKLMNLKTGEEYTAAQLIKQIDGEAKPAERNI